MPGVVRYHAKQILREHGLYSRGGPLPLDRRRMVRMGNSTKRISRDRGLGWELYAEARDLRLNFKVAPPVWPCQRGAELDKTHVMIPRSAKQPGRPDEAYQPLLNNDDEDVLFSGADDSDDDIQVPARLPDPSTSKPSGRSVRFEEDVQVIAPSLKSTTASREAGSCMVDFANCRS